MSAGLMSCVRQSSPPLELTMSSDGPPSSRTTMTSSTTTSPRLDDVHSLNTTHKRRRRFHPLRNLRRIFRIGATDDSSLSSSAYRPASEPDQSDDYTQSCGSRLSPPDTPIRVVSSTTSNPYHNSSSFDSLLYSPSKAHHHPRDARRRHPSTGHYDQQARGQHKPVLHLRKSRESLYRDNEDTTDFQRRSISECLAGDLKNESLSQSHDSVFSESVTASSMSIGLKAELSSVLRKKYYDRGSSSERKEEEDEDLGFPRSPNTPKRGASASSPMKNTHNMSSEGSLSIMSLGSSELNSTYSPSNKFRLTKSKTEPEEDVPIRNFSQPLNHSAARHKMSVRPKKKAPSRMSRIQTVEEVAHESSITILDQVDDSQQARLKSSSLPHGVDAKKSMHHTEMTKSTISITEPAGNTPPIYSNRLMSKSFVVESTLSGSNKQQAESIGTDKDKDVNGFFRRLLNRSSTKKARVPDELPTAASLNTIVSTPDVVQQTKPKPMAKPDKPKSGPAARQRVLPREIQTSPQKINEPQEVIVIKSSTDNLPTTLIHSAELPQVSPKKPIAAPRVFEIRPLRSNSSSKLAFTSGSVARVSSEYNIKLQDEPKSPHVQHRSDDQLFPRFLKNTSAFSDSQTTRTIQSSQSSNQVGRSIDSINEFQTTTSSPTRKPVEKSKSFRFYTETSADSSLHCSVGHMPSLPDLSFTSESSSTTTTTNTDSPNHRDLINKFEINDNNLVASANKTAKLELTGSRKSVFVTTSCDSNGDLSSKSPSRLTSSTVLKLPTDPKIAPSTSNSNINQIEDNIDRIMKFACVTVLKTPVSVSLPAKEDPPARPALPFGRSLSTEDEPKERRFSNESVEISEKPDTETHSSNGVIVERRKSVSDEKLKFERKIQERFRNSVVTESESESRKSSLSDVEAIAAGPAVVLRKKSNVSYGTRPVTTVGTMSTISSGTTSDDQTPELMKVFARRSLKLKDQDDYMVCEDEPKPVVNSPESPTDVMPKSMTESNTTPATSASRVVQKSASLNSTVFPVTTTASIVTPIVSRLSGGYQPSTTPPSINHSQHPNKTITSGLLKASSLITQTQTGSNNNNIIHYTHSLASKANINNYNNNNNTHDVTAIANIVSTNVKSGDDEVNENHEVATIRMADEFKGILQRRAEWEKRATQTFK